MAKKEKKSIEGIPGDDAAASSPEPILVDKADTPNTEVVLDASEANIVSPEQGVDMLKSKLERAKEKYKAEKKARQEAEQAAKQAAQHVQRANTEVEENQVHLVTSAIDTIKREQEFLKNTIKEAMAAGDFDRTMELQEIYQLNINKLVRLEDGLQDMKSNPRPQQQQAITPKSVVDDLISRVTPKSAKWLDKNRSHLKDTKALRIMERAHGDALDTGIAPESKEYFRFIENRLGIQKKEKAEKQAKNQEVYNNNYQESYSEPVMSEASVAKQTRMTAPAAAPVSRSGPNLGPNQRVVTLTPDQAEAARISGMSNKEYWDELQREKTRQTRH